MTKIRKQRTKRFGRFRWVSSSQNSRLSERKRSAVSLERKASPMADVTEQQFNSGMFRSGSFFAELL